MREQPDLAQGRRKRYGRYGGRHTNPIFGIRAANFFISLSPINTQMNVQTRKKMFQVVKSTTTNLRKLLYLFCRDLLATGISI